MPGLMRVTMLGCGASVGVPTLGNNWGNCDPNEPRNRRRRASILVENQGQSVLVDISPDIRAQLLDANVSRLDAILLTHSHADHIHGIDDLRPLYWINRERINVHADADTLRVVMERFGYMFEKSEDSPPYFTPALQARELGEGPLDLAGMTIAHYRQDHGVSGESLGFIFDGRFAYSTDVAVMQEADFARLEGIDLWIVDCLRQEPSQAHANFETTLSWIERVRPKRAVFTHMNASLDYQTTLDNCPAGVEPGYDGLVIEI